MDVKTSSGRVVSILNSTIDDRTSTAKAASAAAPSHSKSRQHSYPFLSQSRRSSSNSVSAWSPDTPALTRSDSDDSRAAQSPSPITPTLSYETEFARNKSHQKSLSEAHLSFPPRPRILQHSSGFHQPPAITPHYDSPSYPLTPVSAMADRHTPQQLPQQQQQQPPSSNYFKPAVTYEGASYSQSTPGPVPNTTPRPAHKKNSYPCPVARQYGCNEFFTTSGHAARHAKKHTGRKDAICPECSKAFTRKDNMEQHRRTHAGVRGSPRAAASLEDMKAKKIKHQQQKKASSPTVSSATTAQSQPMELSMLDPRLMENGVSASVASASVATAGAASAAAPTPAVATGVPSPYHVGQLSPRQATDSVHSYPSPPQYHSTHQSRQSPLSPPSSSAAPALPPSHGLTLARPTLQRSSVRDSLSYRLDPPASIFASSSPATPQYAYGGSIASPSLAPALDALALAASRQ